MKLPGGSGRGTRQAGSCPGFTLLELVVALLILSILLGVAVPSYQRHVLRAERAEVVRMLLAAAACEERIRAQSGYYDTTRCLDVFDSEHFTLRMDPPEDTASTQFTLIAEPRASRVDDVCGALSLNQSGARGIAGEANHLARCWAGR